MKHIDDIWHTRGHDCLSWPKGEYKIEYVYNGCNVYETDRFTRARIPQHSESQSAAYP